MTKSFLEKHEKLIKEENDLKENLQIEITKVKEKLEYFWSEANNQIKIGEKIQQGIKKFDKNEKNLIKSLSYVSKINKHQKNMEILFQEPMTSLKFSYNKEENNIKYDKFYCNVFPTLKKIEYKDI